MGRGLEGRALMKASVIRLGAVLVAACLALPAAGAEAPEKEGGAEAAEKAAQPGAERWLALVDADNYAESWKQAASIFKQQLTAEQWESEVKSLHSHTGRLVSRKFRTAEFTVSMPGAPPGDYVILKYDTSFEKFKTATETVVPTREKDGSWRVSGYFVK
jgi:hypothetical protein